MKTFAIIRKNWEILHSNGNEAIKRIEKSQKAIKELEGLHGSIRTTGRLIKQEGSLEDERLAFWAIFEKFTRQYDLLKTLKSQLHELLQEAVRRKGFEHTFQDPLFVTWPLARLVDDFDAVVHQYSLAYQTTMVSVRDLNEGVCSATECRGDWSDASLVNNRVLARFLDILEVEVPNPAP